MKVLAWDDGFLGSNTDSNVVRELYAIYPSHITVKMKDGSLYDYNNGVLISELYCPKCKNQIPETHIGRENDNVSEGYSGACPDCDEDFYLFEMLNNKEQQCKKGVIRGLMEVIQ